MFSASFLAVKFVILFGSVVVLLVRPDLAPAVVLVNVLPTIPESIQKRNYGLASVAALLAVALALFQWKDAMSPSALGAFLIAYTVWNVAFYLSGHPDVYTAVPQVAVPVIVAAWMFAKDKSPESAMWYFALFRVAILIVLLLHAVSPLSCHRDAPVADIKPASV